MNEMKLSETDQRMFDFMRDREVTTVVDLVAEFGGGERSMIGRVKYFSARVAVHGWIVERVSKLGRGNKAAYAIKKRF